MSASATRLIQRKEPRRVAAEDRRALGVGDLQRADAGEHLLDAPDLMRVIGAGDDMVGAGELDGQAQRARVEVHRVVVKLLEVGAGWAVDVLAAFGEGM